MGRNEGGRNKFGQFRANPGQFRTNVAKTNGLTPPFIPNEFGQFRANPAYSAQIWPIVFVSVLFGFTPPFITPPFVPSQAAQSGHVF